jgi:hypothetical protein
MKPIIDHPVGYEDNTSGSHSMLLSGFALNGQMSHLDGVLLCFLLLSEVPGSVLSVFY